MYRLFHDALELLTEIFFLRMSYVMVLLCFFFCFVTQSEVMNYFFFIFVFYLSFSESLANSCMNTSDINLKTCCRFSNRIFHPDIGFFQFFPHILRFKFSHLSDHNFQIFSLFHVLVCFWFSGFLFFYSFPLFHVW